MRTATRTPARAFAIPLMLALAGPASWSADPLAECDRRVRDAPGALFSYTCYNFAATEAGLWNEAASRLETHVARDPANTYALGALAYLEKMRGRPRAEELLRRVAALQSGRRDVPLGERMWVLLELADFLAQRYRLDEADAVLGEAFSDAETEQDAAAMAQVRINQAWQHWRRADYEEARSTLGRVESRVFADGTPHARAIWLSAMGAVEWARGAFAAALDCYERQAGILEEAGALYDRAGVLYNIALVTADPRREMRPDRISRFEAARDAALRSGNLAVEAAATAELAGLASTAETRRVLARRGLDLGRRSNSASAELGNLRWLAPSLLIEEPRDIGLGRRLLDELEARTRETGDPVLEALALLVRAKVAWHEAALGDAGPGGRERAIEAHLAALDAVEAIRALQPETLFRARTFASWKGAYAALVSHLLAPSGRSALEDELDLSFRVMERARARLLLDEMDAAGVTSALLGGDDPAARSRMRILESISDVQRRLLDPSLSSEERSRLLDELTRLEEREELARREILKSREPLARVAAPAIPSLAELQAVLASDEAFLGFQLFRPTESGAMAWAAASHLLVVTRDEVVSHDLPPAEEIEAAVDLFVGLVAAREPSAGGLAAARLHDRLLADALDGLGPEIDTLLVAPDGALHGLPFAAVLREGRGAEVDEVPRLVIVPSAAALVRWRRTPPQPAPLAALVLVNPASRDAPGTAAESADPALDRERALASWSRLPGLPGTLEEARSIRRHLGHRARIAEDAAASEPFLKQARLDDYAILHIATHAVVDEVAPQRSFIALAAGEGEDGLLQPRELPALALEGKIVVLSACSGVTGQAIETEGMISLARAFLASGAHAVVGSLWPLRDDEAAAFFDRFYRHLGRGARLDEALSAAQAELARSGAPAAAWAGLVLIGDGATAPVRSGSPLPVPAWQILAATALLAIVGSRLVRRRLMRRLAG